MSKPKKLSVIVPVYNEVAHLSAVVDYLMATSCPLDREWIFVDDRSTDGSAALLHELAARYRFQVIEQPKNRGKGAAIRAGIAQATGDLIMIQDADFEYDAADIPALLEPLLQRDADAVFGSRFKQGSPHVHRTFHFFVNKLLTTISNLLSGIYLTDMETCYKIFRADVLKAMRLVSDRFGFEVEVTAYIAKLPVRIFEMPISYYPRTTLQGKKINWRDGMAALWHLLRFNVFTSAKTAFSEAPPRLDRARQPSGGYLRPYSPRLLTE